MKLLQWYIVSKKYVKYLKAFDNKIENIDYQNNLKPFIGIVLNINNYNYYVPVSSPKEKHYKMKDGIDFIKIKKEDRILGVLNLNNMVPVLNKYVKSLKYNEIEEYRTFKTDKERRMYIALLNSELKIINSKYEEINRNAIKLYKEKINNPNSRVSKRCCNFKFLETKLNQYILDQEKSE